MLAVVNRPHAEGFWIEGSIPKDVLDYVENRYGKENVSIVDDYGDEIIDPTEIRNVTLDDEAVGKLRASYYFASRRFPLWCMASAQSAARQPRSLAGYSA